MSAHLRLAYIFLSLLLGLGACVPIAQQYPDSQQFAYKKLRFEDALYEDSIRTVLFYPETGLQEQALFAPVLELSQARPLIIEFDELGDNFKRYNIKVLHCNADWTRSNLNELEYMDDFNEQPINEYQFSFNTKVKYVHYRARLPRVKVSGNYLLKVYRNGIEADVVLTRRFLVYENQVSIALNPGFSNSPAERLQNQQIDFTVSYKNFNIVNPQEDVKVCIRQNYRWDNAITQLRPLTIREFDKILEYTGFNNENNFKGLNEYRYFEAQSVRFLGFNMRLLDASGEVVQSYLSTDRPRNRQAYLRAKDFNGAFLINNFETGNGSTDADYLQVHFALESPLLPEDIYVVGKFNDWKPDARHRLAYNQEKKIYEGNFLLKQGLYNYAYAVATAEGQLDEARIENSHQATENIYEVILYHRPIGVRYDMVIGYRLVQVNQ